METNTSIKTGTAGGTILSIIPNLLSEDILRTVLLAFLGAVVSFSVTLCLKWLTRPKKK